MSSDRATPFLKDPQATLDYALNWGVGPDGKPPWLADGETIASAVVTVPARLVKDREETVSPSGLVTVWLSGGTAGTTYAVNFHITTSQGRVDERTLSIRVTER